jgi:hypothetical protein
MLCTLFVWAGSISSLSDAELASRLAISAGSDHQLPKMEAAICEAMRFKPVGPVVIRTATAPITLSPFLHLNAGDTTIISLASMHRDPAVFPEPEAFNSAANFGPGSRVTAAVTGRESSDLFRPFGHGRKGCVGRELGWMEMKVIMACWLLTLRTVKPPRKETDVGGSTSDTSTTSSTSASTKISGAAASARSAAAGGSAADVVPTMLKQMETRWEVANQPVHPEPLAVRVVPPAMYCPAPAPPVAASACPVLHLYVTGPHGTGKTTLCKALGAYLGPRRLLAPEGEQIATPSAACDANPLNSAFSIKVMTEVARNVMKKHGITREMFQPVHNAAATVVGHTATAQNGGVDPDDNGDSAAGHLLEQSEREQQQRSAVFLQLQKLIVDALHAQLEQDEGDEGGRRQQQQQLVIQDRCVIDALAYTADRFGIMSAEVMRVRV